MDASHRSSGRGARSLPGGQGKGLCEGDSARRRIVRRLGKPEERHPPRPRRIRRADRVEQIARRRAPHRDKSSRLDTATRQPRGPRGPEDVRAGRKASIHVQQQGVVNHVVPFPSAQVSLRTGSGVIERDAREHRQPCVPGNRAAPPVRQPRSQPGQVQQRNRTALARDGGRGVGFRVVEHREDLVHHGPERRLVRRGAPACQRGDRQVADFRDLASGAQAVGVGGQPPVGTVEVQLHRPARRGVHHRAQRAAKRLARERFRRADARSQPDGRHDLGTAGQRAQSRRRGGPRQGQAAAGHDREFAHLPVNAAHITPAQRLGFGDRQRLGAIPDPEGFLQGPGAAREGRWAATESSRQTQQSEHEPARIHRGERPVDCVTAMMGSRSARASSRPSVAAWRLKTVPSKYRASGRWRRSRNNVANS